MYCPLIFLLLIHFSLIPFFGHADQHLHYLQLKIYIFKIPKHYFSQNEFISLLSTTCTRQVSKIDQQQFMESRNFFT